MLNYVVTRKAKVMDTVEEKFSVCDKNIRIYTGECPAKIINIPEGTEIPFVFEGGYTRFRADREEGYTGYSIEL